MRTIYTDDVLKKADVLIFLSNLFGKLTFFYDELEAVGMPAGFDPDNIHHMLFQLRVESQKEEFGAELTIFRMPEENETELFQFIAANLSASFNIRTLVTFSMPGNPCDPYYDLIFENGRVFLADDLQTSFGDNVQGKIKYLSEYDLLMREFDKAGSLSGADFNPQ